jgi:hypothetical protein
MKILFIHGWQSTPGGLKPNFLAKHGHEVLNPALPDDDFDAAVRISQAECYQHHPDVVVGFSRGAAVAMNIDSGSTPLVLLCPAWKRWGEVTTVSAAERRRLLSRGVAFLHQGFLPRSADRVDVWDRGMKLPGSRLAELPSA